MERTEAGILEREAGVKRAATRKKSVLSLGGMFVMGITVIEPPKIDALG